MKKPLVHETQSASELISQRIAELGDWRGETLGRMRELIKQADPGCRRRVEVERYSGLVATTASSAPAKLIRRS